MQPWQPWQMSELELAAGFVLGLDSDRQLPDVLSFPTARAAFEEVLREALNNPPCVVSFSGGRDSSAVLAVATSVARREQLPLPVAVSLRFEGVQSAEEARWQEVVIKQAGVTDWQKVELTTELDLLGPLAISLVSRHGVLWPANTMFHAPVAQLAHGGTLVTGFGGDEIMSPGWAWDRLNRVLARKVRPRKSDLIELAGALGPTFVRRRVLATRPEPSAPSPWLHPHVDEAVRRAWRDMLVAEPVRHDDAVRRYWWSSRYMATVLESLALLAEGYGASILHPFADPRFLAAIADERRRLAPLTRSDAMVALFSDVLPKETLTREGKASFNGAFLGPATREFAASWDGAGVNARLVDVDVLRSIWQSDDPDARTYPVFQAAWAATISGQGR